MSQKIITLIGVVSLFLSANAAFAQGTAFTYQGQLHDNGSLANGSYDLSFTLFTTNTNGAAVAGPVTNLATVVSNGVFTTTIDFGKGVFTGSSNWLQIAVQTNGGAGFTMLYPRQPVTPAPYAITAGNLSGVAGGSNTASGTYSTISGGNLNIAADSGSTIAGGSSNTIQSLGTNSVIGGGSGNGISYASFIGNVGGTGSTIAGGLSNHIAGSFGTIGGGVFNSVINYVTPGGPTVAGGWANSALTFGAVGGGYGNNANDGGMVPGGLQNSANGVCSFAAGQNATAANNGSFVWADGSVSGGFSDTTSNQFLIRAGGGVGIGTSTTPPGGLIVASGGLGVSGASSPHYGTAAGVFIEKTATAGAVYAFNYFSNTASALLLNSPGGNVGINTAAPDAALTVNGSADKPGGGTWSTFSDARLKKNIEPLTGVLDKLLQLHGISFEYIDPAKIHELSGERIGMIAQEVEKVFPDWVENSPNGYKRLTYRGFEALTVEALREMRAEKDAKVRELDQKLAAQNNQNAELRKQNENLEQRLDKLEAALKQLAEQK